MRQSLHPHVLAAVRLIANTLTTDELVALHMALSANWNPREVKGYEKAKSLFTEQEGTQMHSATRVIWEMCVTERLEGREDTNHG